MIWSRDYTQRIIQLCRKYGGFRPRLATIDKADSLVESLALAANEEAISIQTILHFSPERSERGDGSHSLTRVQPGIYSSSGSEAKIAGPLRTLLDELNLKSGINNASSLTSALVVRT